MLRESSSDSSALVYNSVVAKLELGYAGRSNTCLCQSIKFRIGASTDGSRLLTALSLSLYVHAPFVAFF